VLLCAQTPLHLGVITDRSDIVRRLVEAGASPNAADRRGQTCYHVAVKNRDAACLRTLTDTGSQHRDVNAMSYDGVFHCCRPVRAPGAQFTKYLRKNPKFIISFSDVYLISNL